MPDFIAAGAKFVYVPVSRRRRPWRCRGLMISHAMPGSRDRRRREGDRRDSGRKTCDAQRPRPRAQRLRHHVSSQLPPSSAGIAIALAAGDQNGVEEADAEAMRRSGLTHLLSVSGLHIAAVVAFAMLLSLKLLALSERLALRFNLVLVSAGVGAVAGIGYTLLTGAQVPTVRSCVAALLVLAGIALGREAISLRLVASARSSCCSSAPRRLPGQLPDELRRGDRDRRASFDQLVAQAASSGATKVFRPGSSADWSR